MSRMGNYFLEMQEREQEIEMAISEAKSLNMGNTVPVATIISQAAKLARVDEREVEKFYYNGGEINVESASW